LTHCDGVVSDQYLTVCQEAGFRSGDLPSLGDKIKLEPRYLLNTGELLIEVAVKLGQTLWRKALPTEQANADRHISNLLFESLQNQVWQRAQMLGKFAFEQRQLSSDLVKKMIVINYAQALKRGGSSKQAQELLDSIDWSAAAADFKLAQAVLTDGFDCAAKLMISIGKRGDWINEESYHVWPLFLEFRETDLFGKAYQQIFGYPFAKKVIEEAVVASQGASEQLKIGQQGAEEIIDDRDLSQDEFGLSR
jgi:hypothetical protein